MISKNPNSLPASGEADRSSARIDSPRILRSVLHFATTALIIAGMLWSNQSAWGLTFNITAPPTISAQALAAFNAAGDRWEALFFDDMTVNISVDFTTLSPGILGSTSVVSGTLSYADFKTALTADALSADDLAAVASLPAGSSFPLYINRTSDNPNGAGSAIPYIDNDGGANNTTIRMSLANAKAVGAWPAHSPVIDAAIAFSNSFSWDYDPTNGITAGQFDFVGVATHEFGHALGFASGVDILVANAPPNNSPPGPFNDDLFIYVYPMDMFRFSAGSIAAQPGLRDWTADTRVKYFSLDSGAAFAAPNSQFATGQTFGDGRQASHWKDSLGLGIMDPTAAPGELLAITPLDVRGFDVIGYDLTADEVAEVPEPGTLAMAVVGLGILVMAMRRARAATRTPRAGTR
jgi:hypothetical protein